MPQFDATIKHLKEGLKSLTVSAAVQNIEGWEATLEKAEEPAAKTIVNDLENLRKHLHAKELDGEAIRKLVIKLAKETVAIGETGIQLLRMIFSGVFDRRTNLQVIVGHWSELVLFYREDTPSCRRWGGTWTVP